MKDIPFEEYSSYIQGYFDIENISVLERCNFSIDEDNKIIKQYTLDNICYEGNRGKSYRISDRIVLSVNICSNFISSEGLTEVSRKRYKELRDELGNVSVNQTLPKTVHLPVALSETIEKIGITVNQDYTAEYIKNLLPKWKLRVRKHSVLKHPLTNDNVRGLFVHCSLLNL